jgi:hypothetical protein
MSAVHYKVKTSVESKKPHAMRLMKLFPSGKVLVAAVDLFKFLFDFEKDEDVMKEISKNPGFSNCTKETTQDGTEVLVSEYENAIAMVLMAKPPQEDALKRQVAVCEILQKEMRSNSGPEPEEDTLKDLTEGMRLLEAKLKLLEYKAKHVNFYAGAIQQFDDCPDFSGADRRSIKRVCRREIMNIFQ